MALLLVFGTSACITRAHDPRFITTQPVRDQQSPAASAPASSTQPHRININIASADELEALPGIGKGLAQRIIEHREKYGPFRKAEHLIIVRGISEKRFSAVRNLITVE